MSVDTQARTGSWARMFELMGELTDVIAQMAERPTFDIEQIACTRTDRLGDGRMMVTPLDDEERELCSISGDGNALRAWFGDMAGELHAVSR